MDHFYLVQPQLEAMTFNIANHTFLRAYDNPNEVAIGGNVCHTTKSNLIYPV
jgi:hypothetical protein